MKCLIDYITNWKVHRFLAKNTDMSTLCGFNNDRLAVTMLPATLNRRSDAELVPQTHKYLRASFDDGYPLACILHHWRGSASSSIPGAETYRDISKSIRAAGVVRAQHEID